MSCQGDEPAPWTPSTDGDQATARTVGDHQCLATTKRARDANPMQGTDL